MNSRNPIKKHISFSCFRNIINNSILIIYIKKTINIITISQSIYSTIKCPNYALTLKLYQDSFLSV